MNLEIKTQVALSDYTTMRVGGPADFFCKVANLDELKEALNYAKGGILPTFVLGNGSNIIVSDSGFRGLVIRLENKGLEFVGDGDFVLAKAAAGENWDEFVATCVEKQLWGVENLSHIPGSVGAVAVQNVGAYGQEVSKVIDKVAVIDAQTNEVKELTAKDCNFGYRSSIFNTTQRGRYVIWEITFKLSKVPQPELGYRDVAKYFAGKDAPSISLEEIRSAIISIRNSKFTLPKLMPNSGSCFKNVYLQESELPKLTKRIETTFGTEVKEKFEKVIWRQDDGRFKLPVAFLIDICGLKGLASGNALINQTQPLVILNPGGKSKAVEIMELIKIVRKTVYAKVGLVLQTEPVLIGFSEAELKNYFSLD